MSVEIYTNVSSTGTNPPRKLIESRVIITLQKPLEISEGWRHCLGMPKLPCSRTPSLREAAPAAAHGPHSSLHPLRHSLSAHKSFLRVLGLFWLISSHCSSFTSSFCSRKGQAAFGQSSGRSSGPPSVEKSTPGGTGPGLSLWGHLWHFKGQGLCQHCTSQAPCKEATSLRWETWISPGLVGVNLEDLPHRWPLFLWQLIPAERILPAFLQALSQITGKRKKFNDL